MKGGHQHVRPMHKGKATQRAPHRVRVHLQPCPLHAVQQLQALFQAPPSRACSRRPVGRHCPLPLCPALPVLVHLLCANIACCTFKRGKHSRSAFPRKLITFRRLRAASGWDSRSSALKTADSVAGETSAYACAPSMIPDRPLRLPMAGKHPHSRLQRLPWQGLLCCTHLHDAQCMPVGRGGDWACTTMARAPHLSEQLHDLQPITGRLAGCDLFGIASSCVG